MIFKLNNPIKHFAWGCKRSFSDLFHIDNPDRQPQAELWMGAHHNGSSTVIHDGTERYLIDVIDANPSQWLGEYHEQYNSKLPFLVKILAASQPLSIQVHPNKNSAEKGFAKENAEGIAIDAPERNYKDANHKPELVYAITPYLAMNGFRELRVIHQFFSTLTLPSIATILEPFLVTPSQNSLAQLFGAILLLDESEKQLAVTELLRCDVSKECAEIGEVHQLIKELAKLYPCDVGLFAPLFLNVIELQPGEAMFLYAETPHAYLKGVGVEVMANSDNVLRAGLTPKHIDVPELLANTRFVSIKACDLRMMPIKCGDRWSYPIPVDDFKFEVINDGEIIFEPKSPEIILCIDGVVEINTCEYSVILNKGESAFVSGSASDYTVSVQGRISRTYC
ncbi:mannose-6-phosphate isomerase, class I [Vibrio vulnificus]|uniref:mannose-6-phosphate isomerase, class I n=1 Tax=Vibrio vulnificus TaxID=672 RepID=UPI003EDA4EC1